MPGDEESRDEPKRPDPWRSEKPLGEALREQYRQVLQEPVPERLKKLIEALKEKEQQQNED